MLALASLRCALHTQIAPLPVSVVGGWVGGEGACCSEECGCADAASVHTKPKPGAACIQSGCARGSSSYPEGGRARPQCRVRYGAR